MATVEKNSQQIEQLTLAFNTLIANSKFTELLTAWTGTLDDDVKIPVRFDTGSEYEDFFITVAQIVTKIGNNFAELGETNTFTEVNTFADRLLTSKGVDVASANDITLTEGNYFVITGTANVETIATGSWAAGTSIVLQNSGVLTYKHNIAGAGASLFLASSADFAAAVGSTLTLIYDGITWRETARTTF